MLTYASIKGIAGIVVDGALRDLEGIKRCEIPVYCKAITPQGPYRNGPGEINVPVCCGGVAVLPGDIVVGDAEGVVIIRQEDAPHIIEAAENKLASEEKLLQTYRAEGVGESHYINNMKTLEQKGAFITTN